MKSSPLDAIHRELGARMAPFAGWEMPIQYRGIVAEHQSVRSACGVFDISHMGQFTIHGSGSGDWLNRLLSNDTTALEPSSGQYTLMLNENGGVIDDMIVYREAGGDSFFAVVNASKIEEDFSWMKSRLESGIDLENESGGWGGIAVQGPDSPTVWERILPDTALPSRNEICREQSFVVCRTGYTGEDGFELFAPAAEIGEWFFRFVEAGAEPCGLGARDTLRLEKCYPLNGSDLDPDHTPLEAGLGFFVKLKTNHPFVGREILEKQRSDGLKEKLTALEVVGKSPPPRSGYEVLDPEGKERVSQLTSGGLSPTLQKGIAMAYLPVQWCKPGTELQLAIRQRSYPLKVVKRPFLK